MKTSIIIPTYNGLELLRECVDSIRHFTSSEFEIIVVDNGSDDGTVEYCLREKITFVALPENRGFPIACNLGLKIATGDALLLLNNDVVVSHNWLSNQLACLFSRDDIGIVGPYTNYVSGKQQKTPEYETLQQFQDRAYEYNQPNSQEWRSMDRIVGLCFLIKRKLLDQIGYLDERFTPGHFEDDDYCYRARLAGYKLMLVGDVMVHHHGSVSFKRQDSEKLRLLIEQNYQKFVEKWGVDPHQFI